VHVEQREHSPKGRARRHAFGGEREQRRLFLAQLGARRERLEVDSHVVRARHALAQVALLQEQPGHVRRDVLGGAAAEEGVEAGLVEAGGGWRVARAGLVRVLAAQQLAEVRAQPLFRLFLLGCGEGEARRVLALGRCREEVQAEAAVLAREEAHVLKLGAFGQRRELARHRARLRLAANVRLG